MPAGLLLAVIATNMAACPVPGAPVKYKQGVFMGERLVRLQKPLTKLHLAKDLSHAQDVLWSNNVWTPPALF